MKVKKLYKIQKALTDKLGKDLVVGLALDNGNYFVSVSCHKSTQEFSTGRKMQTCQLTEHDLEQDIDKTIEVLVELYSGILQLSPKEAGRQISNALNETINEVLSEKKEAKNNETE